MKSDSQKRLNKDSFEVAGNRKGGNFSWALQPFSEAGRLSSDSPTQWIQKNPQPRLRV